MGWNSNHRRHHAVMLVIPASILYMMYSIMTLSIYDDDATTTTNNNHEFIMEPPVNVTEAYYDIESTHDPPASNNPPPVVTIERSDDLRSVTNHHYTVEQTVLPFVIMTYKRLDYLKAVIHSLKESDFPRDRVPLIISHDGQVPEMITYVQSLQSAFPQLIQLIHPYSCFDHPDTFPGNDPKLNEGYKGDAYGNVRSPHIPCCKHHFTWLMTAVFSIPELMDTADTFLFFEEDHIVGTTIYQALINGLNAMEQFHDATNGGFFGMGLDAQSNRHARKPIPSDPDAWFAEIFSGPMTINRHIFALLQQHAVTYCGLDGFDEYNWDFTILHMQSIGQLPHTMLCPSRQISKHIGVSGGLHTQQEWGDVEVVQDTLNVQFSGNKVQGELSFNAPWKRQQGYGGWGHPADQQHCMKILSNEKQL
jgi:N-acetylglucosaminyltransferase II (MGAT2)